MTFENFIRPNGKLFMSMPKGGSPAFEQGWKDGCESGLGIFTHQFHKHFYKFKKDQRFYGVKFGDERDLFNGKEITDKDKAEYANTWSKTYLWCRHLSLSMNKGGGLSMMPHLPGDDDVYKLHGTDQIYEFQAWGNGSSDGWYANW